MSAIQYVGAAMGELSARPGQVRKGTTRTTVGRGDAPAVIVFARDGC
jgi:hypothetical protein